MEQMLLWDVSWTDEDFEAGISKALSQIDKLRKSFFVKYAYDQKRLEDLEGIIQELISYRADRSQAMGE